MITKIHIRGFRCFKELVFKPAEKMNIIVGGNEAGKSTILEAISMALTGRVNGGRCVGAPNNWMGASTPSRVSPILLTAGRKTGFTTDRWR